MWQSDVGIINKVLVDYTHLLGHRPIWLLGPNTMWAIVIPSIWRGLPLAILIFLAGLQAQPQELHEAAAIDGAGPLRRFRFITLPLLRPLIGVQLLFGVIYAAYQFAIPTVMFGSNPGPDADLMMTLIVRQSFSNQPLRARGGGLDAADARDARVGGGLVPRLPARPGARMTALTFSPRARKRLIDRGLDVLTWLSSLVMLAPVFWLVASSLQNDGQLARGSYDLLHPTFDRLQGHVEDDRLRALPHQQRDHLHDRRAAGHRVRQHRRLRARALPLPRGPAASAWRSSAPS